MALPATGDVVHFVALDSWEDFFSDLAALFPAPLAVAAPHRAPSAAAMEPLEVHVVGSFVASFVPGIADFRRLDTRFRIEPEVWARLP